MVGALAQMVPDKVAGDLCRTSFHNLIGGYDPRAGREWVHYEWSAGGNGAFAEDDGPSAMATIDWGDLVTVQSSEVMETRMPLLVESSRLAIDFGRRRPDARRPVDAARLARAGAGGALFPALGRRGGAGVRRARRPVGRSGRSVDRPRRRHRGLRHARQGRRPSARRGQHRHGALGRWWRLRRPARPRRRARRRRRARGLRLGRRRRASCTGWCWTGQAAWTRQPPPTCASACGLAASGS